MRSVHHSSTAPPRNGHPTVGTGLRRWNNGLHRLAYGALAAVLTMAVMSPIARAGERDDDHDNGHQHPSTAVTWWNEAAGRAALAACIAPLDNPLHESRMYAMTHIAIYDALNAISRRAEPYAVEFHASRTASPEAAVAAAAHDVLLPVLRQIPAPFPASCIDAGVASVEADYTTALSGITNGTAKDQGIAAGRRAAAAIVALRSSDGSDTPLIVAGYPQSTVPGVWRFTPDRPFAFAPGWGGVTPFALKSAAQFKPKPPLDLQSSRYAADFNEIKSLGGDGVTTPSQRTALQTETALFWQESSPLAWNRIARSLAGSAQLDLWEQARLYGLLDIALADGYVSSFDAKYNYNFWRPVTAIREAATDGNPHTTADPTWTPLVTTPPIPDHDSAHAVEGGAAAAVFASFFGTDRFAFSACSRTVAAGTCTEAHPTLHQFTRFSQAAEQNAVSRIYIGFHFRYASEQGLRHGGRIGSWVADTLLRPVD